MIRPTYEGLFKDCVFYGDFVGDQVQNVIDSSISTTNSGTVAAVDRFNISGGARVFDNTNYDNINLGFVPTGNIWTLSCFIKTTSTAQYPAIFYCNNGASDRLTIYGSPGPANIGKLYIQVRMGSTSNMLIYQTNAATGFNDGNWHLLTFVIDGSSSTPLAGIYQDGVAVASSYSTQLSIVSNTLASNIYVGRPDTRANDYTMSDTMIWNRVFSAGEVKVLYQILSYKRIYPFMRRTCQQ